MFGVAALVYLFASPAEAHRSGCHRWHTCPSDTGSYTMGSPAVNVPTTRVASAPAVTSSYTSSASNAMMTSNVNLRASASRAGRVLRVVPKSAVVSLYSCAGTWCRVKYQGQEGYVSKDYVNPVKVNSLQTVPVTPPAQSVVYYANCTAARAAGAAPLYAGDPGYRSKLDRDGDGVACE